MKTNLYEQLLKIKQPVLILLSRPESDYLAHRKLNRIRILYPNGKCSYSFESRYVTPHGNFSNSCFVPDKNTTLAKTVAAMKSYDGIGLKIVEVIEL